MEEKKQYEDLYNTIDEQVELMKNEYLELEKLSRPYTDKMEKLSFKIQQILNVKNIILRELDSKDLGLKIIFKKDFRIETINKLLNEE